MSVFKEVELRLSEPSADAHPCWQLRKLVASWGYNVFGQGWLIDNDVILDVKCLDAAKATFDILTMEEERGQGKASVVLDRFLAAADELGVTLIAYPKPFGTRKGLTTAQLKKWYERHGFTPLPRRKDAMIHYPPQVEE